MSDAADTQRQIGDTIRLGTIAEVDLVAGLCTVDVGDITTSPVPWLTFRAGATRTWSPPTVGEQVVLLSPEGDAAAGVVLLGLFSDDHPAPADTAIDLTAYGDGAVVSYDPETHTLTAVLPDGGTANITAPGGINLTADITISGNVTVSGTLSAADDVLASGISLKNHKHGGVQAGGAQTGTPV